MKLMSGSFTEWLPGCSVNISIKEVTGKQHRIRCLGHSHPQLLCAAVIAPSATLTAVAQKTEASGGSC